MNDVIPATHLDLLESVAMAHIATIGPSGEPQNSPVWFGWDGEFIRFTQLTTLRQKARNLEREPRVAISNTDPADPYRYLEVRGRMERIEPDPAGAYIDVMAKKYMGVNIYPHRNDGDDFVVVVIRPEKTTKMG